MTLVYILSGILLRGVFILALLFFSGCLDTGQMARESSKRTQQIAQLYRQGRYQEAIPLAERSLAIREKALGSHHPEVAESLNNLAILHYALGDYAQAGPLFKQALAIREKVLGSYHPEVAESLNDLAILHYALGDYAKAGPLYKRALDIREKALGPSHPLVATGLNGLGGLYYALGDYAQAGPLFKRALAIGEKALGPDHPDVATSLNNLATLHDALGDYARAEPLLKRALAIREKALGPSHPEVTSAKGNLGFCYLEQGKLEEAYEILKETKNSGPALLGLYYLMKGDRQAAQEQFRAALKKTPAHIEQLVAVYIGLGLSFEDLGQYREAADSYRWAVERIEEQKAALAPAERAHFLDGMAGAQFKRSLAYEGLARVKGKLLDPVDETGRERP